jgi:hypothetical protein
MHDRPNSNSGNPLVMLNARKSISVCPQLMLDDLNLFRFAHNRCISAPTEFQFARPSTLKAQTGMSFGRLSTSEDKNEFQFARRSTHEG